MTWSNAILKKNSLQVTLSTVNIKENITKANTVITPGKSSAQFSTDTSDPNYGPYQSKIVDLLRIERRITITGNLTTGLGTGDTSTNASDKRNDLRNIIYAGGEITMTFEGNDITGNIDKIEFEHSGGMDGLEPGDGEIGFEVTLTFVAGVDV